MLPTYYKDGHLFFREGSGIDSILGDRLIINPNRINEICTYIKEHRIKSISINPAFYQVNNLEFLKDINFIEGVYILQENLELSVLNELKDLKVLRAGKVNTLLDFNNFKNLEVLGITYSKFTKNIGSCKKLFWLWLDNFNQDDLQEFSKLSNLQYLSLNKSSIKNLIGMDGMLKIKELHIDTANKLQSLSGISENNKYLEFVDVYGAKNLSDYTAISNAPSIKKIVFTKTGEIPRISFLKKLPNLENVVIGMKVLDGDMSYLKKVPKVNFLDYPHYNLKMKDF